VNFINNLSNTFKIVILLEIIAYYEWPQPLKSYQKNYYLNFRPQFYSLLEMTIVFCSITNCMPVFQAINNENIYPWLTDNVYGINLNFNFSSCTFRDGKFVLTRFWQWHWFLLCHVFFHYNYNFIHGWNVIHSFRFS